ncbi:MAG: 8-oxo-dGTP diphosphatase [Clostridia bacterium]|nr:8-oxo-dGTP diphosphatase [Clostridia bacterium]
MNQTKPFGTGAKFYNMTMVVRKDGKVLTLDRIKTDWPGLTFPGGKVEKGESFTASAIREIKEETGLSVSSLVPCGAVHWADQTTGHRYIEFLYKTTDFHGEILSGTSEGRVFWEDPETLRTSDRLSPNFDLYLPLFLDGGYSELFFEWDGVSWEGIPQYFSYR